MSESGDDFEEVDVGAGVVRGRRWRFLAFGFAACSLYYFVLPAFWPPPCASAVLPRELVLGDRLEFEVITSAWHANHDVYLMRLFIDKEKSTCPGPEGLPPYIILLQGSAREFSQDRWFRQWTWPSRRRYSFRVSLDNYVDQGRLGPGRLIGRVDVLQTFDPGIWQRATQQQQQMVPFEIEIRARP